MTTTTTVRASLEGFRINGVSPFWSAADSADQRLSEAHALLTLLEGAEDVCEKASDEIADAYDNIRHEIKARAFSGIAALIAFAQYQNDMAHDARSPVSRAARQWNDLKASYDAAAAEMEAWNGVQDTSTCGSPENIAHEARTATIADAHDTAMTALLLCPSPDAVALRFKLGIMAGPTMAGETHWQGAQIAKAIAADADRLLTDA